MENCAVNRKAIDSTKDKGPHTLADGQLSTNVGSSELVKLGERNHSHWLAVGKSVHDKSQYHSNFCRTTFSIRSGYIKQEGSDSSWQMQTLPVSLLWMTETGHLHLVVWSSFLSEPQVNKLVQMPPLNQSSWFEFDLPCISLTLRLPSCEKSAPITTGLFTLTQACLYITLKS